MGGFEEFGLELFFWEEGSGRSFDLVCDFLIWGGWKEFFLWLLIFRFFRGVVDFRR